MDEHRQNEDLSALQSLKNKQNLNRLKVMGGCSGGFSVGQRDKTMCVRVWKPNHIKTKMQLKKKTLNSLKLTLKQNE